MAFFHPVSPAIVSRPSFSDYLSVAGLFLEHSRDYPEEALPFWKPTFKLLTVKHLPMPKIFEPQEASQAPQTTSCAIWPDYETSSQMVHMMSSSFPEESTYLWRPHVMLPPAQNTSTIQPDAIIDLLGETSRTEHMLIDHPCFPPKRKHVRLTNAQNLLDEPISSHGLQQALCAERAGLGTHLQPPNDPLSTKEAQQTLRAFTESPALGKFSHDLAQIVSSVTDTTVNRPSTDTSKSNSGSKNDLDIIPILVLLKMQEPTKADSEMEALVRVIASRKFSELQHESFFREFNECYRVFEAIHRGVIPYLWAEGLTVRVMGWAGCKLHEWGWTDGLSQWSETRTDSLDGVKSNLGNR